MSAAPHTWVTDSTVPLAVPRLDGAELDSVKECLSSTLVSSVAPVVERFEGAFARAVGVRHAIACSSGTAALHVALRVAGAGPGRLVAVSALTFIASANAARYTGADVLLVDSEPTTWNLDTARLYDEVVRRAAAGARVPDIVEPVHILGHPVDVEPLLALRERFDVRIVEDAAEALGASWLHGPVAGRQVGTVGDLGCYSFNGNKIVTTGAGGMMATDDDQLADRARHLTTQAKLPGIGYAHDDVGYNYRLSGVAAAIGVAQLERLAAFLTAKRRIAARYDDALDGLPLTLPPRAQWANPSCWLYSVLLDPGTVTPAEAIRFLAAAGVQARPLWPPLHRQPPYRDAQRLGGDVATRIHERGLSLPCSTGLADSDQDRVIAAVRSLLEGGRRA